ncbi:TlpA family protein disulfide reductase [Alicyclobacillus hesperidum]|uniref:TlpA family protein disulfide reductase n=1 Tax=Alicyclobacillus hesperidum TaxID=89784 RepID=UPI0002F1A0F8|nr:conjugal transfer protein TraF [Alicyclobacillus hesperidum]
MRRVGVITILCAALAIGTVSGCGTAGAANQSRGAKVVRNQVHPLVFQNRTSDNIIAPDTKLDSQPVRGSLYKDVLVLQANGKSAHLDVTHGPLLFVAYWCPHCQRTLQLLTKLQSQLKQIPTLVDVGYPSGATLADAVRIDRAERAQLHLANFPTYFILAPNAGDQYAPLGYPTLVYRQGGQTLSLFGEHTSAIWKQILS